MDLKLYEITGDIASILNSEEWTEDTERQLEALEMALDKKAENVCHFIADLESFTTAAKAEEKRIAERRRSAENRIESVKNYIKRCMEEADRAEIEAGTHKLRIQKNNPRVVVDSEQHIPPRFFIVIPEQQQLDKKALSDELKRGPVEGAHLEQGTSLRIR